MATNLKKTTVKGGYLVRHEITGRLAEVGTSSVTSKSGAKTAQVIKEASERRKSALKRLADR
ncbi:hypothetical protein [Roseovarius sp. MBR-6]|jgi:hypothetical protein|uniref:hypothetical protein n=1 Tax=Roseovarius sp. MBR-6 TaxID=3156459 RepID=UPI00339191FA